MIRRCLLVTVLCVFLGGCTASPFALKILYGQFDNYLNRELLSFADFSELQEQRIRREVDAFVRWHRYQALPLYKTRINELQRRLLDSEATASDIEWLFNTVTKTGEEFADNSPVLKLIPLLSSLSDRQIEQIGEKIQTELDETRAEQEKSRARGAAREATKSLTKFCKRLGVRLTRSQRQMTTGHFARRKLSDQARQVSWQQWSAQLMQILSSRQQAGFGQRFAQHYSSRMELIATEHREPWLHDQQLLKDMLLQLFNSFSSPQKNALRIRLQSFSELATELSSS